LLLLPALFNIFINSLFVCLNANVTDILNCLFYANDKVILVRELVNAQQLLDLAKAWTKHTGFIFNVKKCAVLI
jgi:hypothetical protein